MHINDNTYMYIYNVNMQERSSIGANQTKMHFSPAKTINTPGSMLLRLAAG